jgi:hypothetical protein
MEPRNYIVTVDLDGNQAILRCLVYFLDQARNQRGFEFHQVMGQFVFAQLPAGRQATFAEELRATRSAADVSTTPEETDEVVIRQRMQAVFGNQAHVNVQGPYYISPR